jgi:hypothetical protein
MDPVELILVGYDNEERAGIVLIDLVRIERALKIEFVGTVVILKD